MTRGTNSALEALKNGLRVTVRAIRHDDRDAVVAALRELDPRSYMKLGEAGLAEWVKQAVTKLRGLGTTLFGSGR